MNRISAKASPGFYEHLFCDLVDPAVIRTLYDIGVGPKSEYTTISGKYPSISLFGTEPNKEYYNRIKGAFPGQLLSYAISEKGGDSLVDFYLHKENLMASGIIPYDREGVEDVVQVKSMTLDEFDEACGHQDGILIWMDIEGYELKALKSAPSLLESGRVKLLNLEVRSRWNGKSNGCTEEEVDNFLAGFGFRKIFSYNHYRSSHHHDSVYASVDYRPPASAQGLLSIFSEATGLAKRGSFEDISLAIVDLYISRMEAADKVSYLRAQASNQ